MQPPYILLVEDDVELGPLVAGRLREQNYEVALATDGQAALDAVAQRTPDLLILDLMLPRVDGLEVCRRVRAEHPLVYILMLTARAEEVDRVVGLEVGADDYVTKPFSLSELVARVRAGLRRIRLLQEQPSSATSSDVIHQGDLVIDLERREVRRGDEVIYLTVREFDLLHFLARNPDRPFTRAQLLNKVWDIQYEGYDRTVDSHIQRLRAKLELDPGNPRFIKTVWGVGYRFQPQEG